MIETDRLIAAEPQALPEEQVDRAIRPKTLEEYTGAAGCSRTDGDFPVRRSKGQGRASGSHVDLRSARPGQDDAWRASSPRKWGVSAEDHERAGPGERRATSRRL